MADLSGIQNQTLIDEIEEYLERPEEIARFVELFTQAKPRLLEIAAAIIEGDDDGVDELTAQALEEGIEAIEIMDDGLIG
ncbi:MAG: B12-binding domain-containing protein, partial [Alphaproteobacteria bacterium]